MACSRLGNIKAIRTTQTFPALHVQSKPMVASSPFAFGVSKKPSFSMFHTNAKSYQEGAAEEVKKEETKEAGKEASKEGEEAKIDPRDTKLKELEEEVLDLKNKLAYSYAERENIRRIAKEDLHKEKEYGISNFAKNLLDVADNLSRCLQSVTKEDVSDNKSLKPLLEGVEMTEKELLKTLKKFGIERYEPMNQKFDPNKMNALVQYPVEGKEPGTVASVLKAGFFIKDRVLRPADVAVVKPPEEGS